MGFTQTPPPGGYRWWYVDGLSEDGRQGVTVIVFIGSVFSPYYAWRGRRAPENHVCVNVALYGDGWQRWSMTERGRSALKRDPSRYLVGDSGISLTEDGVRIDVVERAVPHLAPLRGAIRLRFRDEQTTAYALDAARRHWWRPIAPAADIEVDFRKPGFRWRGAGYADMNWGDEPIEDGFARWDWSRAPVGRGAAVLYDVTRPDGARMPLALRFDGSGGVEDFSPPVRHTLPNTLYGLKRWIQADPDASPKIIRRCEDAPFYARSEVSTRLFGVDTHAMHENIDLPRFRAPWVRVMLPWRMPRVA